MRRFFIDKSLCILIRELNTFLQCFLYIFRCSNNLIFIALIYINNVCLLPHIINTDYLQFSFSILDLNEEQVIRLPLQIRYGGQLSSG